MNHRPMSNKNKPIWIIMFFSLVIHIYMLLVSGAWWDDYKYSVINYADIKKHMIAAGRLDAYYLILPVNSLPAWAFHLVIILCFAISAVFIYLIINDIFHCDEDAFWIAVLYNAIPVNDIRVMKCVYPYTVSHALFWTASYLLIVICQNREKKLRFPERIVALLLFYISFSTNSLMFFYAVPIALFWIRIGLKLKRGNNLCFNNFIKEAIKWVDFYILPFAFFIIKLKFFSPDPNGLDAGYNLVTIDKCFSALMIIPKATIVLLGKIFLAGIEVVYQNSWLIMVFVVLFVITVRSQEKVDDNEAKVKGFKKSALGCMLGIILIIMGMYPYLVIRQNTLGIVGINGRDAILACFGVSVLIVFGVKLIRVSKWGQRLLFSYMVIMATVYFTSCYSGYLRDHYYHMALRNAWIQTDDIKTGHTFICVRSDNNFTIPDNFYALNAMALETYGDAGRYIASGVEELRYITSYEKKELMKSDITYAYSEYDLKDIKIDGIMRVSCCMNGIDATKLKIIEMMNKDTFEEVLNGYIEYKYIPVSAEESKIIYERFLADELQNNRELLRLLAIPE